MRWRKLPAANVLTARPSPRTDGGAHSEQRCSPQQAPLVRPRLDHAALGQVSGPWGHLRLPKNTPAIVIANVCVDQAAFATGRISHRRALSPHIEISGDRDLSAMSYPDSHPRSLHNNVRTASSMIASDEFQASQTFI